MTISSSPEVIQQLRRMSGETGEDTGYSDEDLDAVIAIADGNLRAAAAQIWDEKAANLAGLVDVSESGSSRRLSQAHANALTMAKGYRDGDAAEELSSPARARIGTIRRP